MGICGHSQDVPDSQDEEFPIVFVSQVCVVVSVATMGVLDEAGILRDLWRSRLHLATVATVLVQRHSEVLAADNKTRSQSVMGRKQGTFL